MMDGNTGQNHFTLTFNEMASGGFPHCEMDFLRLIGIEKVTLFSPQYATQLKHW
jgi:hypothetical protein